MPQFTKIVFAEFASHFGQPAWSKDAVARHSQVTNKLRFLLNQTPPYLGDTRITLDSLDLLGYEGVGGWVSALLPHVASLAECEYVRIQPSEIVEGAIRVEQALRGEQGLVLLSLTCLHVDQARTLLNRLRECDPRPTVILGGTHPTSLPLECLRQVEPDVLVRGEADHVITPLIRHLAEGRSFEHRSVVYKDQDRLPTVTFATPDDRLHSWDFFLKYNPPNNRFTPRLSMDRFCIANCGFCYKLPTKQLFPAIGSRGGKFLSDYVDRTGNPRAYLELEDPDLNLEAMDHTGVFTFLCETNLLWEGMCRTREVTPERRRILQNARTSGALCLFVGVESFQQHVLDVLGKNVNASDIAPWLAAIKDAGIGTAMNLIMGLPGQTEDDIRKDIDMTADLIAKGVIDSCGITFLILYPGTRFANNPGGYGIVQHDNSFGRLETEVQHSTRDLTAAQIQSWYLVALEVIGAALSERLKSATSQHINQVHPKHAITIDREKCAQRQATESNA